MARKKVREHDAKRLIKAHLHRLAGIDLPLKVAQVNASTDPSSLQVLHEWLSAPGARLVVKPDMLFGQRGKHDLVGLNLDFKGAWDFIQARLGKNVDVNGAVGPITTFLIEPFVPHKVEHYLSITSGRLSNEISFNESGGVDIEEHWASLRSVQLDPLQPLTGAILAPLLATSPLEGRADLEAFISGLYAVFLDLDVTLLEMNPFTIDPVSGRPLPLDVRLELDDTAKFRSGAKWGGDLEFPLPFGRTLTPAEEFIASLDGVTGASLKFTVLNPKGRVWLMVAGGGASVIYTDTVADLGFAEELGNYGEYSGAPNTSETYQYAKTVLSCATAFPDGRGRALVIGGGIANFTDVAATFTGIIQALREYSSQLKAAKVRLFVRRGGPNYLKGLQLMRELGAELGLPIDVHGPEASMTGICADAIEYVKST